jgi:hypothetical protein
MARGRRLRKSAGGELEMNKENDTASDDAILQPNVVVSGEAILLPNVAVSDEAILLPHVVVTAKQNMAGGDEESNDRNSVVTDQPIGEQNGALS